MQARVNQPRRLHGPEATQQCGRDSRSQQGKSVAQSAPRNQVAAISQGSDILLLLLPNQLSQLTCLSPSVASLFFSFFILFKSGREVEPLVTRGWLMSPKERRYGG